MLADPGGDSDDDYVGGPQNGVPVAGNLFVSARSYLSTAVGASSRDFPEHGSFTQERASRGSGRDMIQEDVRDWAQNMRSRVIIPLSSCFCTCVQRCLLYSMLAEKVVKLHLLVCGHDASCLHIGCIRCF